MSEKTWERRKGRVKDRMKPTRELIYLSTYKLCQYNLLQGRGGRRSAGCVRRAAERGGRE